MTDIERNKQKFRNMLYSEPATTMQLDYQDEKFQFDTSEPTVYKPKPKRETGPATELGNYVQTMGPWKKKLPFDNFIIPNPIVRGNPHKMQQPFYANIDDEREEVMRSRPRVIIAPQANLDVIQEPVRSNFIKDVYVSEMQRAYAERKLYKNIKAPFPGHPAPANPIALRSLHVPRVSPEWRKESMEWDSKQARSYCDPTKQFWLMDQNTPSCTTCDATKQAVNYRRKKRLKQQL